MAQEFKALGHQVVIVVSDKTLSGQGRLPEHEIMDGLDVYRFKRIQLGSSIFHLFINLMDVVKNYILIRKLNRRYRFNLAVLRSASVGLGAAFALRNTKTLYVLPAIHSKQDRIPVHGFTGNTIVRQLKYLVHEHVFLRQTSCFQRLLLKVASKSFVFSRNMRTQVSNIAPGLVSKIEIIKPGVDSSTFSPGNKKARLRNLLKIPVDGYVFLIIGRIVKVKGIDIAIKALAKSNQLDILLVVVGDGPEVAELKDLAMGLGVEDRILFFPSTNNPKEYYQAADAFVMSSTYEPFGQTILEAMSSGLPVIGFKYDSDRVLTATDEIVEDNVNGFLCDFGVAPLANALSKCIALSAEEYNQIAKKNREKMKSIFTWKKFCDELLKV